MNRLRFWIAVDISLLMLFGIAAYRILLQPAGNPQTLLAENTPVASTDAAVAASLDAATATPSIPTPTELVPPPPLYIAPPSATPAATDMSTSTVTIQYTVQDGDHLFAIARRFGVTYSELLAANPGINPDLISPGQVISIPAPAQANSVQPTTVAAPQAQETVPPSASTSTPETVLALALTPTPSDQPTTASPATATITRTPTPAATPTRTRTVAPPTPVPTKAPASQGVAPPSWILGPIQGSGEDDKFITDLLWFIDNYKIPITTIHFDSDRWQSCSNNGDWRWSSSLLDRMRGHNPPLRALFWILPLITTNCREYGEAAGQGFFVKNGDGSPMVTRSWQGTGSWIDFNNPAAVAYWHSLLDRAFGEAQGVIGGFYTDDLVPELSQAYSDSFVRDLITYTRSKVPDGDVVLKSYGMNTPDNAFIAQYGHLGYVNDLDSTFNGLRESIRRVLAISNILPAPFSEFTGYNMRVPDSETYIRRTHWGAFQPIMENDPLPKNAVPWDPGYPPQVLQAYQYYSTLHWELVPFFHTYDELAYRDNRPIFQQPNAGNYSTILGKEIFVQYVTESTQNLNITLPAGQWINYWNEAQVFTGPATIPYPVPLGREPILIANGAIIPMQVRDGSTGHGTTASAGALTVNVFPNGRSTFSYFDSGGSANSTVGRWVGFDVRQAGNALTLCTSAAPSQPLIYRIARWQSAPARVSTQQGAVGVNTDWGRAIAPQGSEQAVDAAAEGWFFDAVRQHLIVKLTQLGGGCP